MNGSQCILIVRQKKLPPCSLTASKTRRQLTLSKGTEKIVFLVMRKSSQWIYRRWGCPLFSSSWRWSTRRYALTFCWHFWNFCNSRHRCRLPAKLRLDRRKKQSFQRCGVYRKHCQTSRCSWRARIHSQFLCNPITMTSATPPMWMLGPGDSTCACGLWHW